MDPENSSESSESDGLSAAMSAATTSGPGGSHTPGPPSGGRERKKTFKLRMFDTLGRKKNRDQLDALLTDQLPDTVVGKATNHLRGKNVRQRLLPPIPHADPLCVKHTPMRRCQ